MENGLRKVISDSPLREGGEGGVKRAKKAAIEWEKIV